MSPVWLTAVAVIVGITCIGLTIAATILALSEGEWQTAALFAGLLTFCVWGTAALCLASLSPALGMGSRLTLIGFFAGSMLTLFESPLDVLRGDLAAISVWQGVCWALGTACVAWGLERERKKA